MARLSMILAFIPSALCAFESWSLTFLDEAAERQGAVCLDGSPPAYYMEAGQGSDADKWVVHLQGGGWCVNETDCLERSKTFLGSSKGYVDDKEDILGGYDGGAHGLLSNDPAVNPDFHNWNKVYVRYCDGGSMAGEGGPPLEVQGEKIYFRGGRVLNAVIDDLLRQGVAEASELIVEGCSAGGLNVWLHADHVRSRVPDSVRVVAIPQCGFFMDLPAVDGSPSFTPLYKNVFEMMGARNSRTLSEECFAAHPGEEWRCFLAQYNLPFVRTPFFAVNSFYDSWQWRNILLVPDDCDADNLSSCTTQEQNAVHDFRDALLGNLTVSVSEGNAFYTYGCYTHCGQFLHDDRWGVLESQGVTLRDAFTQWYRDGTPVRISAPTEEPNENLSCKSVGVVV